LAVRDGRGGGGGGRRLEGAHFSDRSRHCFLSRPPCAQADEEKEDGDGDEEEEEEGKGDDGAVGEGCESSEEAKLLLEALAAADPDVHAKVVSTSSFCCIM
jgi:hypothetical protein